MLVMIYMDLNFRQFPTNRKGCTVSPLSVENHISNSNASPQFSPLSLMPWCGGRERGSWSGGGPGRVASLLGLPGVGEGTMKEWGGAHPLAHYQLGGGVAPSLASCPGQLDNQVAWKSTAEAVASSPLPHS